MSIGSIIVLVIVALACAGAVVYNVKRRGSCNCGGCTGCSENSKSECGCADNASSLDAHCDECECEANLVSQSKNAHYNPASFACASCAMKSSCNHIK